MNATAEIVVVGGYNRDVSVQLKHLPAPGETCLGLGRLESPGGKGATQAIQAARCGAATAMIAAIGEDAAGREALAFWARYGVATDHVAQIADCGTGMALILVDSAGENAIVVDSAANGRLGPEHVEAARATIGRSQLIMAQLETPVSASLAAFAIARQGDGLTLLNAAPAPDANTRGITPSTMAAVVIKIGRRRVAEACSIASRLLFPSRCKSLANCTMRMPCLLMRPISVTRPTSV